MIGIQAASPLPMAGGQTFHAAGAAGSMHRSLRWACVFVMAGLLLLLLDGSWRMSMIQRAKIIQVGEVEIFEQPDWTVLPLASRLAALGAMALVFASASIALLGEARHALPGRCIIMYGGMWFVAGYLLIGLTTDPWYTLFTSRSLLGKMAPGTLMGLGVFFLAAHPGAWRILTKNLLRLTAAACLVWLVCASRMAHPSRAEAYRWIFEPTLLLEVLAVLPLGLVAGRGGLRMAARWGPLLLLTLGAVLLQGRLMVVELVLLIGTYGLLRWRAGALKSESRRGRLLFGLAIGLPAALLVGAVALPLAEGTLLGESAQRFWARRAEDTRTGQIRPFFEKATPLKLLIGAGYPAKEEYTGEGAGGIDSGYLNTMYVTGLPMVALLVWLMVIPAVGCLRRRLTPADAAVTAAALTWCVRLSSSTIPAFSAQFLVACLLLGRCARIYYSENKIKLE